ncbi:hypothetical protein F5884DRAFT_798809 [Xylogone sp. PMI_703]|nr:hypothetical protein F5884DRAFT_798809 [Xylogone sp. PMI_703]
MTSQLRKAALFSDWSEPHPQIIVEPNIKLDFSPPYIKKRKMEVETPVTPTRAARYHKASANTTPIRSARKSPRKSPYPRRSPYTRRSPTKRPDMSQNSPVKQKEGFSKNEFSWPVQFLEDMTMDELRLLIPSHSHLLGNMAMDELRLLMCGTTGERTVYDAIIEQYEYGDGEEDHEVKEGVIDESMRQLLKERRELLERDPELLRRQMRAEREKAKKEKAEKEKER